MKRLVLKLALRILKKKLFKKEIEVWGKVISMRDKCELSILKEAVSNLEYLIEE